MKKILMWIAVAGLLSGCSWVSSSGRPAAEGSGTTTWGQTGGISTGADAGTSDKTR